MPRVRYQHTKHVNFMDDDAAYADIVGFAGFLARLFGNKRRGLAALIRLTPEYRAWRAQVERCPHCHGMIGIIREVGGALGQSVRFVPHDHPAQPGTTCPGSGRHTRWTGNDDDTAHIARAQLARAIQQTQAHSFTGRG